VYHRVDDLDELSGPRFFSLARRIGVYGGALAAVRAHHAQRRVAIESAPAMSLSDWVARHPEAMARAAETFNQRPKGGVPRGVQDR
jgi:hypothetical protein